MTPGTICRLKVGSVTMLVRVGERARDGRKYTIRPADVGGATRRSGWVTFRLPPCRPERLTIDPSSPYQER